MKDEQPVRILVNKDGLEIDGRAAPEIIYAAMAAHELAVHADKVAADKDLKASRLESLTNLLMPFAVGGAIALLLFLGSLAMKLVFPATSQPVQSQQR